MTRRSLVEFGVGREKAPVVPIERFRATEAESCDIDLSIGDEFEGRDLGALMGAMFGRGLRKYAEAFETRADEVSGR